MAVEISYFKSAWNDIKHTPKWLGKVIKLALLNLIPIFGQIVTLGYLYGWARDIAWGVHQPLPDKILSNEDGQLYRRGFFGLVVAFVIGLLPALISAVGDILLGGGVVGVASAHARYSVLGMSSVVIGEALFLLALVANLAAYVFTPVGIMRMSIYNRLSAGLQLGRIWKMLRHDSRGALRIAVMAILAGIAAGFATSVLGALAAAPFVGLFAASGMGAESVSVALLYSLGALGAVFLLVFVLFSLGVVVFVNMLTVRAVGYWVFQFDVAHWGGQDDPMPFEGAAR